RGLSHAYLFLLLIPPPPISPLFPYTTLFRSVIVIYSALGGFLAVSLTHVLQATLMFVALVVLPATAIASLGGFSGLGDALDSREDRKSTRLNSSHVKISYAVFCLKKKTIT